MLDERAMILLPCFCLEGEGEEELNGGGRWAGSSPCFGLSFVPLDKLSALQIRHVFVKRSRARDYLTCGT